jgi:hypothetical protein
LISFAFLRGWRPVNNRFDQFAKQLARDGLSPSGQVVTDAEVSPDAQHIDVWFVPRAGRPLKGLAWLGLLGRIARPSCTLEAFHRTPSGEVAADCVAKHRFFWRELARRTPRPPMPMQWIVSSGRPSAALSGLAFRRSRWGRGIYDGPVLTRTRLVVASELGRTRDTLLIRLMGAGVTLKRAIVDVQALPPEAPERLLALPILLQLRLNVIANPANQTKSDREFLMNTQNVTEYLAEVKEEGREEGREEGLEAGLVRAVMAAYRTRFGEPPPAVAAGIQRVGDPAELQRLVEMVITGSAAEVAAAVRKPRAKSAAQTKGARRVAAPRRPAASR